MDDFKDAPKSITEIKADRDENGSTWTPRDVLIRMLRDLDSGLVKPHALAVVFSEVSDEKPVTCKVRFLTSSPDYLHAVGMMEEAKRLYMMNGDE